MDRAAHERNGPSKVRPLKVTKRSNFERADQNSTSISFSPHPTYSKNPSSDALAARSPPASYQTIPFPVSGFSIAITMTLPV